MSGFDPERPYLPPTGPAPVASRSAFLRSYFPSSARAFSSTASAITACPSDDGWKAPEHVLASTSWNHSMACRFITDFRMAEEMW